MADMFQGWRVPVLRQDWQKKRFLESVFGPNWLWSSRMLWAKGCQWPPWGFLHENSLKGPKPLPLQCHNKAGENRASYLFLAGTQERFPWNFFCSPLKQKPRTNQSSSDFTFREINLGCAEASKKVLCTTGWWNPLNFPPFSFSQNVPKSCHDQPWDCSYIYSWEFLFLDVLGVRGFFVSNFISSPSLPVTISILFMQLVWEGPISNLTSKTGRNGPLRMHECPSKRKTRHPQSRDPHSLKLTANAPKNGWLEYEFPCGMAYFQGYVSFREGRQFIVLN